MEDFTEKHEKTLKDNNNHQRVTESVMSVQDSQSSPSIIIKIEQPSSPIIDKKEQQAKVMSTEDLCEQIKGDGKTSDEAAEVKLLEIENNVYDKQEDSVPENSKRMSHASALRLISGAEDSKLLSGKQIQTMVKQVNNSKYNRVNSPIQYEDDEDEGEDYSGSDIDLDFELELQQLKSQTSLGFQQINAELKQTRIDRIDKYLKIITELKKKLSENYEKNFQDTIKHISPSLDSRTGLDVDEGQTSSNFSYPLQTRDLKKIFLGISDSRNSDINDKIDDFPIFTRQFNRLLSKDQESFKAINNRYRYEFDQIESLKKGNTVIIWKQFMENVQQAKKRKLQLLEKEMCDIEHRIYNIKPDYSSASQFASRVPEFANINNKNRYAARREELDGAYRKFQIVPSRYDKTTTGPLKHVSPAESAQQDLQLIDMIVSKKRKLRSQYSGFLKEVLALHNEKESTTGKLPEELPEELPNELLDDLGTSSVKSETGSLKIDEPIIKHDTGNTKEGNPIIVSEKEGREHGKINLADLL